MTKKNFSLLFLLIATVLNIVTTIVIIVALIVLSMLIIRGLLHIEDPLVAMIAWMVCFIGGIVLDMFAYSKLMNYSITRFKLEDKLDPRMLGKRGAAAAAKEKASKPKTVMPKSVLGNEEEDTWGQTAYGDNADYTPTIAPEDATYTPLNPEDFAGKRENEDQ